MRLADLEGRSVAIWGLGREGHAAWRVLRQRWPGQPFVVVGRESERAAVEASSDARVHWRDESDEHVWRGVDVVIKSPGISALNPQLARCREQGVAVTSGTALWFAESLPGLKVIVTGTKGKSTTCSLIAHLLRARGLAVGLVGNVGVPLLDVVAPALVPAVWVIELSSYQTGDAGVADVAMVLNLFPEHLDWHGDVERYFADKLSVAAQGRAGTVILNARDERLHAFGAVRADVRWFDQSPSWREEGGRLMRGARAFDEACSFALPGRHNLSNLAAALTAIEALGFDPRPQLGSLASFRGLPHRLQLLGERDGVSFVNDSISTTPHASVAALSCFADRHVAIIVGGHDRGVDWHDFVAYLRANPIAHVAALGPHGAKIAEIIRQQTPAQSVSENVDLDSACASARAALKRGGVLLLSPGAPSYGMFRDHVERGVSFAKLAGFGDAEVEGIGGLGIR